MLHGFWMIQDLEGQEGVIGMLCNGLEGSILACFSMHVKGAWHLERN